MTPAPSRLVRRLLSLVGAAALAAALSACGGSDDGDIGPPSLEVPGGAADGSEVQQGEPEPQDGGQGSELKPIEFLLPQEATVPSGFHTIPAKCETGTGANEYRAWSSFAVPDGWEAAGMTSGSGSPIDDGTTVEFGTGSDRASVDVKSDTIQPDGIGDGQGGLWTTFDYEYTSGEESGTVEFEEIGTVPVADQQVTIWAAPHDQAPQFLKVTEYKARVEVAHLYGLWLDGSAATPSFVVTIKPTHEEKELDEEVVRGIVGSFAMPACAREHTIVGRELATSRDLDGDGYVSTADDYRTLLEGNAS